MKASETKFQPLIEGTKQYVVPLFQRPYSWDKKEWTLLWEDLVWLCENDEPKSHFIGSIVTVPTTSVPEGVTKYLLIDGQQRLTTIFVLLALLRDRSYISQNARLAEEIEKTLLVNQFKEGADYLKLLPTQSDRQAFKKLVEERNSNDESRIHQCYFFFDRKLRQSSIDPNALSRVITNRLSVVSIVLDLEDNPHLVFESLNAKGRPLTQADLIRNFFFMKIHVKDQDKIHGQFWHPMQEGLGESLTEFIRHYLMRNGALVKQGDVYFTLKDRVSNTDVYRTLEEISKFANYYKRLIEPNSEKDPQIRTALQRILRLEITTAYPFLLNCYDDYATGAITAEDLVEILRTVENYVVRRFVCNIPTSQLNKIFPGLYQQAQLASASGLVAKVKSALQSRGYPRDSEFRARLRDARLYGAGERLVKTKLILESLEAYHGHKEQVPFTNLTVEHVMPQTLNDWWKEHLGEDWQGIHELHLHTLGNLTLTAYNSELSNDAFYKKKTLLVESHLELNKYFEAASKWTLEEIEARSERLAELALEVWPFFGDGQVQPSSIEDVTGKVPKELIILGQRFNVGSWRDVQTHTLNTLAELEPDLFTTLVAEYPRFISTDANRFRRNRQLENGMYIEVNLSARDIYRFCTQAIELIGLADTDWSVVAD